MRGARHGWSSLAGTTGAPEPQNLPTAQVASSQLMCWQPGLLAHGITWPNREGTKPGKQCQKMGRVMEEQRSSANSGAQGAHVAISKSQATPWVIQVGSSRAGMLVSSGETVLSGGII